MARNYSDDDIDDALFRRVAGLPPGGQRWLKTAIRYRTMPSARKTMRLGPAEARWPGAETPLPGGLEDVLTGKARLEDQLESYPELADELKGMGDIIDMLREQGEQRRKTGEQILREEILGDHPPERRARRGRRADLVRNTKGR
jgi:hypothetical protein